MGSGAGKTSRYIPTLDGWRAVAIGLVLFSHTRLPHGFLASLSPYGAIGVHVFFAISGFLITFRLLEEYRLFGAISLRAFYLRRFFRILPPAFGYLACAALLGLALAWIPMNLGQLAAGAFFYRNYYSSGVEYSWYTGHFWSLSVEEHFYLLWPGLMVLSGVRKARYLAPALACAVALWRALDVHYGWIASVAPALRESVARTDYRLDGLLWGCALALAWETAAGRAWLTRLLPKGSLIALVAAVAGLLWAQPPGYVPLLALLFPLCLCSTVARPDSWAGRFLELGAVAWVGRISYSLYLWQQLFLPAEGVPARLGVLQVFPLNLAMAVGAAAASYYVVERPLIAYGRRLVSRQPGLEVRRAA